MMWTRRRLLLAGLAVPAARAQGVTYRLDSRTTQALVGVTEGWESSTVGLQRYERTAGGPWRPVGTGWMARLGASGLVWGRGLNPIPERARTKTEGDRRAPAGVFALGGVWGYDPNVARHPRVPYSQVGVQDLWVEDPNSPYYNQHLRLDHAPQTPWERKQQMKQADPAHALKLLIQHNAPPRAVPGGGSAIFFHIWRAGGKRATSGCTAMAEPDLRGLIRWVDPDRRPVYVLLPRAEYTRLRGAWGLP